MKARKNFLCAIVVLFLISCDKKSSKIICTVCPEYAVASPNINFKVVNKTTGQDLFFDQNSPYKPSQIKIFHIINGKPDSVSFIFYADTVAHDFFLGVGTVHRTDTITMKIADLSSDTFLFNTETVGVCCPQLELASALFDGAIIYTSTNGPKVITLTK